MRFAEASSLLICGAALLTAGCAQPEVYTEPYVTLASVDFAPPLPVTLEVTYSKDGKPDPRKAQEIETLLADALGKGTTFQPAGPASAGSRLEITVDDVAGTGKRSILAGITASVGHVLVSEPEFTPQGRRTTRSLSVNISYTPATGSTVVQTYTSALVTVTNNTLEPTDLVPLQDRAHPELVLIENDLNGFAAGLHKDSATAP